MHIEPLTAASTPPPFTFEETQVEQPGFILAAPRPAPRPAASRRLDWTAISAAAFVYAIAFFAWTLLAR